MMINTDKYYRERYRANTVVGMAKIWKHTV